MRLGLIASALLLVTGLNARADEPETFKPWSYDLSTQAVRGMSDYADTWFFGAALKVTHRPNNESEWGLKVGYDTILYKAGGHLFDNYDVDPNRFGLTDTRIYYSRPNIWSDSHNKLLMFTALNLPTSEISKRATLLGEVIAGVALIYRPMARWTISPLAGIYFRHYTYDTANRTAFGSTERSYNSPYGLTYGLSGKYEVVRWLAVSGDYAQVQRVDYKNRWLVIQMASIGMTAKLDRSWSLMAGYEWRDRIITNERLFADDRSKIYMGVGYSF